MFLVILFVWLIVFLVVFITPFVPTMCLGPRRRWVGAGIVIIAPDRTSRMVDFYIDDDNGYGNDRNITVGTLRRTFNTDDIAYFDDQEIRIVGRQLDVDIVDGDDIDIDGLHRTFNNDDDWSTGLGCGFGCRFWRANGRGYGR